MQGRVRDIDLPGDPHRSSRSPPNCLVRQSVALTNTLADSE